MRAKWEVADVIASHGSSFLKAHPQPYQVIKTLKALRECRTAALGGHKLECGRCGHEQYRYNSCRNRHCPKCQGVDREKWIWHREAELLPVPYFHMVFTLPSELNGLAMHKPKEVYNSLFRAASRTMEKFAGDPGHLGARTGMTAVLHTWGQNLSLHPHLHCIVPGGGLTASGKWKDARNKGKYLFPTKALAKVFRAGFMEQLRGTGVKVDQAIAKKLFSRQWVVYAKRPFSGPERVIEYLGRYTHRIAISNHRIKRISPDGTVRFTWKDYRHGNRKKLMKLPAHEFLRRFCQHVLPHGFVRIRHYGLLASRNKATLLNRAREYFDMEPWERPQKVEWEQVAEQRMDFTPDRCPECEEGVMRIIASFEPMRGPPLTTIEPNKEFHAA